MPSAQRVQWARVRTSCVILVALAILSVLVYLLTGGSLFTQKARIYFYVPDASGLTAGSPVRADGVDVGKVQRIELSGSNQPLRVIRVTLSIGRAELAKISDDSNAQLSTDSLVGDMFVDISSGSSPRRIQPGSELAYQAQPELLKTLDLQQFDAALRSVDATLTDIEQGKSRVGQFVIGTQFYNDLRKRLGEIEKAFRGGAAVSGTVGKPLYTDRLYQRIRDPIVAFDRSLAAIQAGQGAAGQLLRDTAQYDHFRTVAQDLRKSIEGIRSAGFMQSDRAYEDLSRSIASLIRSVDEFNTSPLLMNSSVYDNLNGLAKEIRESARDFHSNPKGYMWMKIF
jgi:ABC-type transporter Mla subunit MlaD